MWDWERERERERKKERETKGNKTERGLDEDECISYEPMIAYKVYKIILVF